MNPEQAFQQFLEQESLQGQKLLLSVSGGVDSTVLLHTACKVTDPEHIAVFHLDHGARKESAEDSQFVHNLCSDLGVQFFGAELEEIPSKNKEDTWRTARKQLSQETQTQWGTDRTLTAHHATDLVETMLFRLTKGVGISGMSPFDPHTKPFLSLTKQDIEEYAKTHSIQHRTDETNTDISIPRNRIRHQVLPQLRHITQNLEKVFLAQAQTFADAGEYIHSQLPPCPTHSIPLANFLSLPPILRKELLRSISHTTPSSTEVDDCLRWLAGNPQGNTTKEIGSTILTLKNNTLSWG